MRDISRTFPKHMLFREKLGFGYFVFKTNNCLIIVLKTKNSQKSLYRILRAYCTYNKKIGYCQGMGFITAFLLNYYDEEVNISNKKNKF